MSANHAPRLSQLIHMPTLDPAEAERASLREQLAAVSAGLVAEAKCAPDNREDMREEKATWLRRWEKTVGGLFGKALGVSVQVNTEDAPTLAEANDLYEQWTTEEAEAQTKVEQDIQMGEETAVELGDDRAVRMSHVEVLQPARKWSRQTIAERDEEPARPKIHIPATGMITHKEPCMQCALKRISCTGMLGKTCDGCVKIKQGCEKSSKAAGKKAQVGASVAQSMKAPKASLSKQGHNGNDDDDIMEVVESRAHSKALTMVRAEAAALHAATMRLQVHVNQLMEVLKELGIE
ncbi:hypothetical protein M404DRAFT_22687 [Pisolithus tinctorius Marx 270]|uniref:Zn(2)-C6 fungal-type domain-containing protein n=1 Tax=Pisolithus tinctorius Marx 270 TaxID=870435 RepID=A0A0C3KH23_PISTI|nr:hypothetical protein M404DRAFT_22687 [Pisolithus tinctorius Marx 270]